MFSEDDPANDDLRVCNCCECGAVLLGPREADRQFRLHKGLPAWLPTYAIVMRGRPYCPPCSHPRHVPAGRAGPADDGPGPWGENAVRHLEGD